MATSTQVAGSLSITYTTDNSGNVSVSVINSTTGENIASATGAANDVPFSINRVLQTISSKYNKLDDQLHAPDGPLDQIDELQAQLKSTLPSDVDMVRFINEQITQQQALADKITSQQADLLNAKNQIFSSQSLVTSLSTESTIPTDPVQPDNATTSTNSTVTTADAVSTGSDGNSADNPTDPQQPATASAAIPETQGEEIVVNAPRGSADPGSLDDSVYSESSSVNDDTSIIEDDTSAPVDGMPPNPRAAKATWNGAQDLRVKLRVPNSYLVGPAAGPSNIIANNGGILFPYTPEISYDNKAEYAPQTPLHSNFAQYFYKHSLVGPISITAKFTVQNEQEGAVLLGVIHLLRALVKMRFGNDPQKGSPPPVCRLDAYGDYMMQNVPVVITSWKHTLPDNVDFITVGRPGNPTTYGVTMVPVLSTISLDLNIMYSRQEMLNHNVPDWLNGNLSGQGYL